MRIQWIIWKDQFVEKLRTKHGVAPREAEEALRTGAHFRKAEKGRIPGEDLFAAYGRSSAGRYLLVLFVFKRPDTALPISARDMTDAERKYYARRK